MLRRYADEQTTSRLAVWAIRMVLFSLVATVVAIVIVRSGTLEIRPALATFVAAVSLAAVAIPLALAALVMIWIEGSKGMSYALSALVIGGALLAYPGYLGMKALKLPWIYDITTDPIDPPRFDILARIRPREANPVIYAGLSAAEQQRTAYPDIEPLESDASPQATFNAALAVINRRKWRIVDLRPPTATRREGRIEAVARSPIMGFRDDVVVRVRTANAGARLDIRSSSRYGPFDFGENAGRIRKLVEDIDRAIDVEREREPAPVPAAPKATKSGKDGQSAKR